MITTPVISKNSFLPDTFSFGSPARTSLSWNNLIIEKRISMNWLHRLYEGSIFQDCWLVLSSKAN